MRVVHSMYIRLAVACARVSVVGGGGEQTSKRANEQASRCIVSIERRYGLPLHILRDSNLFLGFGVFAYILSSLAFHEMYSMYMCVRPWLVLYILSSCRGKKEGGG